MFDIKHEFIPFTPNGRPATVFFAGSLSVWYGPMVERLVQASSGGPLRFEIFGSHAMPVGAGALTALHERPACPEAR